MAKQTFTAGQVLTATQVNNLQANDYNWTVNTSTTSYTLQASDVGTRRVMNAAGATTITVNTGIFAAGDFLYLSNINSGICTVTAGTATVTTAGSLAIPQWGGGILYFTSTSAAVYFPSATTSGKIGQVLSTIKTDTFTTTSTTFVDVTGVSRAITPSSASSQVLVFVSGIISNTGNFNNRLNLMRGSTNIAQSTGSGTGEQTLSGYTGTAGTDGDVFSIVFLDSPATTSSTTYKIQVASVNAASTLYIGRYAANDLYRSVTTITVMEVLP